MAVVVVVVVVDSIAATVTAIAIRITARGRTVDRATTSRRRRCSR